MYDVHSGYIVCSINKNAVNTVNRSNMTSCQCSLTQRWYWPRHWVLVMHEIGAIPCTAGKARVAAWLHCRPEMARYTTDISENPKYRHFFRHIYRIFIVSNNYFNIVSLSYHKKIEVNYCIVIVSIKQKKLHKFWPWKTQSNPSSFLKNISI